MANFKGQECPVCHQIFQESDDIVVCPECGTPHHRECYLKTGHCSNEENHGKQTYQEQQREKERAAEEEQREQLRCPRCGSHVESGTLFCPLCGAVLGHSGATSRTGPIPIELSSPFGGLDPDEEIGGVPVQDLALHMGENARYFLPRFKQMKQGALFSVNFSAFFFHFYYFIYRKMFWIGAVLMAVSLLLAAPSFLITFDAMRLSVDANLAPLFDQEMLTRLSLIGTMVGFLLRLCSGLFANRIYMETVLRRVRKLKKQYGESPDYPVRLAQYGRVSRNGFLVALGITALISVIASYFAMWLI